MDIPSQLSFLLAFSKDVEKMPAMAKRNLFNVLLTRLVSKMRSTIAIKNILQK